MTALLPFLILSLVADVIICALGPWSGWMLAAMAVVFYIVSLLGLLLAYVLIVGFITLFFNMAKPQERVEPFWRAVTTYTMGLINALFRVRIHLEGEELIPRAGKWLFICNHIGGFDPIASCWALREHNIAFITKPSIMRIPIANRVLHRACFMPIDRDNDRAALVTIIRAANYLKNGVTNVGIYPEGTRSKTGELQPFRNGAFKIAQKAKADIVVAHIRGSEKVMKNFPLRPTDVYLKICRVISSGETAGMNTNEIGEEARRCIMLESA